MNKNLGKNEASGFRNKSGAFMIVSIIAVSLFFGTALQPAIAQPLLEVNVEVEEDDDECTLCRTRERSAETTKKCKSCSEMVVHTMKFMMKHVNDSVDGIYFLWTVDATLYIFEGIILGIKDSGFELDVDEDELKDYIGKTIDRLIGEQHFSVTKFLAVLGAISVGISGYLLSLCKENEAKSPDTDGAPPVIVFHILSRVIRLINRIKQTILNIQRDINKVNLG
jgi:hypothetical protein